MGLAAIVAVVLAAACLAASTFFAVRRSEDRLTDLVVQEVRRVSASVTAHENHHQVSTEALVEIARLRMRERDSDELNVTLIRELKRLDHISERLNGIDERVTKAIEAAQWHSYAAGLDEQLTTPAVQAGGDVVPFNRDQRPTAARPRSSHAEQLRVAMGWDRCPEMTPEERAKFEEDNRAAQERARRYYGPAEETG